MKELTDRLAVVADAASSSKVAAAPGAAAATAGLMGWLSEAAIVLTVVFLVLQIAMLLWSWRRKKIQYDLRDSQFGEFPKPLRDEDD